uniref:Uncharacterized protein n=2 Tax=Anopheles atroparvus TaxID=41427 RepID=A0A182JFC7_ANOAO
MVPAIRPHVTVKSITFITHLYIQQTQCKPENANKMRFLIVLAALVAVALANPLISIRVNVDNAEGEVGPPRPPGPGPNPVDPELPPPQPYTKQQLKRDVASADGKVVFPVPTNEGNPAGTLVNIEVFVDNQRQEGGAPGNPDDLPPPQPY